MVVYIWKLRIHLEIVAEVNRFHGMVLLTRIIYLLETVGEADLAFSRKLWMLQLIALF